MTFVPIWRKKFPITAENNLLLYSSIHFETQILLFEMLLKFDFMLLLNDSKCISLINYINLENITNFEYSENFPNSGFMSLIFPIRKSLGPLPKIAKKIPGLTTLSIKDL